MQDRTEYLIDPTIGNALSGDAGAHNAISQNTIGFGDGRKWKLKYFQYSSESSQFIQNPKDIHELEEGRLDIEYDASFSGKFSFARLWAYTGPGWLMSIAYLDPGNLESDLQAGAVAGYQLIWVLWWSTVLGWFIQTLSARLGVVTGKHLAQICRYEYNKPLALLLWVATELAIIGSDIQEVVGSAVAFKVLFGWPLWIGCLVTAIDAFTFLLLSKLGMRTLESFFISLIGVMAVCFLIEFCIGSPDFPGILKGWVVPLCDTDHMEQAVGMVGAVIMPHNLFLHSALVQTRNLHRNKVTAVKEGNYYFAIEGGLSLLVSFFINLFIISVFASGFHNNSDYNANDIGLMDAASNLGDRFGGAAKYIFAIGLLAAGQSSTMTGTFAGQYCMSGFLQLHWEPWKRTLLTRVFALGPSLFIAIAAQSNLDNLDEWLNVQQSVQLPFALLPLLFFNCNPRIMGQFRLSRKWELFFWTATCAVITINVYLTVVFIGGLKVLSDPIKYTVLGVFLFLYLGIIAWLIFDFVKQRSNDFNYGHKYNIQEHIDDEYDDDDDDEMARKGSADMYADEIPIAINASIVSNFK